MLLAALPVSARTVELRVLDEHGRPAAARLKARDSAGKLLPLKIPGAIVAHPAFADLGVVFENRLAFDLPLAATQLEIDRGAEYRVAILPVTRLRTRETVRLRRWIDMPRQGWWPADLHVHREPADVPLLMRAADVHLAPVLTRWNDRPSTAPWQPPFETVFDTNRAWTINNAEDERPWGAALFFGLPEPPRLFPFRSNLPPPMAAWPERAAHYLELEKPIWWGAPVVALLAHPDSVGIVNNHFLEEGMFDNEAWGRPRDRARYPGPRGYADYVSMLYARYLSAGLRIPASAGSANGVLKNPLGYSRVYAYLDGPFSTAAWWKAQRAGRNFVTNGPMLFLTVDGQKPGAILPDGPRTVTVKVEARSRAEIETVEVLVDGVVVKTFPARGAVQVPVESGSWIAARCIEKDPRTVRMAHTSPVYIGATARRDPAAIAWMREWIAAWRVELRKRPDSAEFEALCDRAEAALR